MPSVSVRLVDPETEQELPLSSEKEGELRVQGPTVFKQYWHRIEASQDAFDSQGWFKTGDIAQFSNAKQSFRIRGRASADILKTGGYKLSALDIERVLLLHPQIQECAVFGIPDEKWGQRIAAVLRCKEPTMSSSEDLRPRLTDFLQHELANYSVPREFHVVQAIPKNAMGKINKKGLAKAYGAH